MKQAVSDDNVLRDLAMAVARNNVGANHPLQQVVASEGLTLSDYQDIAKNPQFIRYVDGFTNDLKENGFSFAAKARVLAEDLLPHTYHMAKDTDTPAAVRMKAIENLVEWGDLKPKNNQTMQNGPGFSITISLPDPSGSKTHSITVDHPDQSEETALDRPSLDAYDRCLNLPSLGRVPVDFFEPEDYEYAGDDVPEPPMAARTP
jgi:hypothetical protein